MRECLPFFMIHSPTHSTASLAGNQVEATPRTLTARIRQLWAFGLFCTCHNVPDYHHEIKQQDWGFTRWFNKAFLRFFEASSDKWSALDSKARSHQYIWLFQFKIYKSMLIYLTLLQHLKVWWPSLMHSNLLFWTQLHKHSLANWNELATLMKLHSSTMTSYHKAEVVWHLVMEWRIWRIAADNGMKDMTHTWLLPQKDPRFAPN